MSSFTVFIDDSPLPIHHSRFAFPIFRLFRNMKRLSPLIRWMLQVGIILILLMTFMRLFFFFYFNNQGFSFFKSSDAFFLGLRYDLRWIAIVLLLMLLIGSIPFFHPFKNITAKKIWIVALTLIVTAIVFFYFIDFAHYSYLTQRLNASVLNYLEDAGISLNMVWQSYPVLKIIFGIVLFTIILNWLIRRGHRNIQKRNMQVSKKNQVIGFIVSFFILGFFIFGQFNQYPLRWSDAFALGSDYKASLALNPLESFFNTLKFRYSGYDEKKVRQLYPVLAPYYGLKINDSTSLNFERSYSPDTVVSNPPNIVLVICESFSAYKSSAFGNPLNTTPFFDSLTRNGIFFDRCFTPTYGTARGVWAVITGMPDVETPSTASRNPAAVDQHTIINDFTQHEKFYFIGGSSSWANIRGLLTNNIEGLHLYEQENFDAPKIDVWGISDKNLLLLSSKILAKQNKPFFAVIQTADNHRPYTIPEEDLREFRRVTVPADSLQKYGFESEAEMNAFRYTDFCYKKFIEAAQKEKYFDNTIFVFIGDHGIAGNAENIFPKVWTQQRLTGEHVPLLFYSPKLLPAQRIKNICSQVDVLPTVAGLSKISYSNTTLGRDILKTDSSKSFAFIIDRDYDQIGLVKGDYFYRKQLKTGADELVSIINNEPTGDSPNIRELTTEMKLLTEAMYETSKYLLLNNKKKKSNN